MKPIETKLELVKYFKKLYTDEIQLNFDTYFYIENVDGKVLNLSFPSNKYYYINGTLNMNECISFYNWIITKEKKRVLIKNSDLDELRKEKVKDILDIRITDEEYTIISSSREYVFKAEEYKPTEMDFNFVLSKEIPVDEMKKSVLISYLNNNEISFTDGELLFESALKNIKIIFKKEALYRLYATEKNEDVRVIMLEASGNNCTLRQFFKVI